LSQVSREHALEQLEKSYPWPDSSPSQSSSRLEVLPDPSLFKGLVQRDDPVILEIGTTFDGVSRAFLENYPQARIVRLGPSFDTAVDLRDRSIPMRVDFDTGLSELKRAGLEPDLIFVEGGARFEGMVDFLTELIESYPEKRLYGRMETSCENCRALRQLRGQRSAFFLGTTGYWWLGEPFGPLEARNQQLLLSVHIPKTAGTSFAKVLETLYGKRLQKLYEPSFDPITNRVLCVHGHFLPAHFFHRYQKARAITWLRNPTDRVISHYRFYKRQPQPDDPVWQQIHEQGLSLLEFARLPLMTNRQSFFLEDLAFDDYDFIGITEQFDRSVQLFAKIFRLSIRSKPIHLNTAPESCAVASSVRTEIARLNEADWELYRRALGRFEQQCKEL
jgi:hypothetical protein